MIKFLISWDWGGKRIYSASEVHSKYVGNLQAIWKTTASINTNTQFIIMRTYKILSYIYLTM